MESNQLTESHDWEIQDENFGTGRANEVRESLSLIEIDSRSDIKDVEDKKRDIVDIYLLFTLFFLKLQKKNVAFNDMKNVNCLILD